MRVDFDRRPNHVSTPTVHMESISLLQTQKEVVAGQRKVGPRPLPAASPGAQVPRGTDRGVWLRHPGRGRAARRAAAQGVRSHGSFISFGSPQLGSGYPNWLDSYQHL